MQRKIRFAKIQTLVLAFLLLAVLVMSTTQLLFVNSQNSDAEFTNEELLQYEWPQLGGGAGWNLFSAGPAPNSPEVLWTTRVTGIITGFAGTPTAFNGFVFGTTSTSVNAFDAFTGQSRWTYTQAGANFQSSPTEIDDTYLLLDGGTGAGGLGITSTIGQLTNATITVLRISDGSFVSNFTVVGVGFQPGAGGYFPGRFDPETKMKYVRGYNGQTNELSYYAINLTDPQNPSLGWKTVLDESGEELAAGGGMVWVGTVNGAILAMDGRTGEIVWRAQKVGFAQYTATYIAEEDMLIQTSASTTITAYRASTGEVIWDRDQGGRAFFAFAGATGYGRFFQHNIAVTPSGFIGCWDIRTGDMLWSQPALYSIGYITPALADGKLFLQRYSGTAAGIPGEINAFSCFDAFTGELLWELQGVSIVHPVVAYGNLYTIIGNVIHCFSDRSAADWAMWRGNVNQPGITQSTGPQNLSTGPKWMFGTNAPIFSSAAVAEGKVYFGSQDNNIYCIDAFNGTRIWNFTTKYRVFSSPAVVNGRVFTGADDGSVYALDAETGAQLWNTPAGNVTNFTFAATWQPRSSPIVVGNRVFVGSLDNKTYCFDASNGNTLWTFTTQRPIGGSPAYANGTVYIGSTDHYLYAINAETGNLVWRTRSNATIARSYTDWFPFSTPVIFNNTVYWGAGPVYGRLDFLALNATTGNQIWMVTSTNETGVSAANTVIRVLGNSPQSTTPVVLQWNSTLSVIIMPENKGIVVRNANNGSVISRQWLGHEVYSSVAYSNNTFSPTFYVGSNTYSITAFNATAAVNNQTSQVLSVFNTMSHIQASPSIWNGRLYIGSADGNMYMFSSSPTFNRLSLSAASSKGDQMLVNEEVTIAGRLNPGIPNATITVTFTKPDGSSEDITTTTGLYGDFSITYTPTQTGQWGWVAYYNGEANRAISYGAANTDFMTLNVSSQGGGAGTPTPTTTGGGGPIDWTIPLIAIVVVIIIIIAAVALLRRR